MNTRLHMVRDSLDLSRAAFGANLGVSGDVINNLERGRVEIKDSMIKLICSVYSVNESWLRTGEGDDMFIQIAGDEALERQIREFLKDGNDSFRERLVSLLLRLPPEQWETLEHYAQELIGSRAVPSAVSEEERKREKVLDVMEKDIGDMTDEEYEIYTREVRREALAERAAEDAAKASPNAGRKEA